MKDDATFLLVVKMTLKRTKIVFRDVSNHCP